MLGRLLQKATEDMSSQDLHDRALLYYRLLRTASPTDFKIVRDVIDTNTSIEGDLNFAEEGFDDILRDELMKEFNTLSIVYGTTSDNFIAEENQLTFVKMPAEHPLDRGAARAHVQDAVMNNLALQVQETSIFGTDQGVPATSTAPVAHVPAPVPAATAAPEMDLLGFGYGTEPTPAPVGPPNANASTFSLKPNVTLSGDEYQSKWSAVSDANAHVIIVPLSSQPPSTDAVELPLAQASIKTMASGELPTELKFYLYAQEASPDASTILVQASITKNTPCEIFLTIKIAGPGGVEKAEAFVDILKSTISSFVY